MSFIDLMASDRWSESDIVNRTEAMIAGSYSAAQAAILARIVAAANAGVYTMTDAEKAEMANYNQVCLAARQAGDDARADMATLGPVLDVEQGLADQSTLSATGLALLQERAVTNTPPAPTPANLEAGA